MRLAAMLPLLLFALLGRARVQVDVENLAMKSVGTEAEVVADLRAQKFGQDPQMLLLLSPRAPEVLAPIDARELRAWIGELRARPEVLSLADYPSPNPGEHCVVLGLRTDDQGRYAEAVERLDAAARESVPPQYRIASAGVPVVEVAIAREMTAERARILPLIAGALALVLLAIYRSPVLVLGALLAPLIGVLLLEGLQGWARLAVDPVSGLLGPSILTVGVAASVHVLEAYRLALAEGRAVGAASLRAAAGLRVPFSLAVLTTIAGFLGLLTSPIPAVQRFGLLASVGIVLTISSTFLFLPSLLRRLHRPRKPRPVEPGRAALQRVLGLRRWSGLLLAAAATLTLVGAGLMVDMRVDSDPLHVLSPDSLARRDAETVAERLGGSEVLELLLPPGGPDGLLATLGLIGETVALDGIVAPAGTPRTSAGGHQLLSFLLAPGGSAGRELLFGRVERLAADAGWQGARTTGLAVRVARDSNDLVHAQRKGILITLGCLWLAMAIGFRSAWLALLGLVPNVLPLVVIQGGLGALGLPLSVASSMIGVVMLGLVVDDTIHLLHAYRKAPGGSVRRVARALQTVGRPIVITTLVLCAGFSVTVLGELGATREFGALAVATLMLALAADLLVIPALLLWERPRLARTRLEAQHA